MYFKKYLFIIFFSAALIFIFTAPANAAILSLVPEAKSVGVGQEFNIDVKVNTEDAGINATQATVKFPNDVLTLVSADKKDSIFNFWVEEPVISNDDGTLSFIGGTPKGIFGGSLQILRMKFKATGAGSAELGVSNAVVTASDGKGTNVLSTIEGTTVAVGTKGITSAPSAASPKFAPAKVEEPQKVVREAVPVRVLPKKPELKVTLYPDQLLWYSQVGEVIALWEVSTDVIGIATKLDKNPSTKPVEMEKELFTGKSFGVLAEGVWYIHARFKNNVGLGETAHYKISLDTTAPLPFEAEIDNPVSDNPTPEVRHKTQDSFSGIAETLIFIDGKGPLKSKEVFTKIPPQEPGKHTILVRILDQAGNGVQDDLEFEILPLPMPTIDFVSKTVYQGEIIFASGKAIPNAFVNVHIVDNGGREVFAGKAPSDNSGNWGFSTSETIARGTYLLSATALDSRGAMSYPTKQFTFEVKTKPVISFGGIELGWFGIFLASVLVIIAGVSIVAWYYVSRKKTHEAYKIIVGRDVEKLSTLLSGHLKELENTQEIHDPSRSTKAVALIERMKETIAKMKKYIGEEVGKLK